jgi:hypothetical protein
MLQMLLARLTDKLLVFQETGTPPASQEKPVTRRKNKNKCTSDTADELHQ